MGNILFFVILVIGIVSIVKLVNKSNKKELEDWNKNNKKKFETYLDLKEHIRTTRLYAKEDERIKESKKQIVKPKRESFTKTIFSRGGSLTGKIARLKKLYKNGTLTKAEFEKAKNKLLK